MEELKFVWLSGIDDCDVGEEKDISCLKEMKREGKINFYENDTPYFVAVKDKYIEELTNRVETEMEDVEVGIGTNIHDFFSIYFEQCGIELESGFGKRYSISVETEKVLYMLIDEKDIYFTEEIQNKILNGNLKEELYSLAEKMYKDQLTYILNDLKASLSLAKLNR